MIKNKTQVEPWVNGEVHRLRHPVGKQYSYNKGPEIDKDSFHFS